MKTAARLLSWLSLALVTSLAGWGCGVHDEPVAPDTEQVPLLTEETPVVAAPAGQGAPRPGPVRSPVSSPPGTSAADGSGTRAGRYFAHARFSLVRDEKGKPLGVRADSVLANGRVYWAGVQEQDLLTRINNVLLNDPRTFPLAVRMVEDQFLLGRPQRIHIVRNGKASALIPMGAIKSEPVLPEQEPEQP